MIGQKALPLLWDDSLEPGVQIALFVVIDRALDVPSRALLDAQVRTETPVAWWCIDMLPEDWVAEAERQEYADLKVKGRPSFDLSAQLAALDDALPRTFNVDVDFNGTLLDAERALPMPHACEMFPQVGHFDEPISPTDTDGNRTLRKELSRPIVHHFGEVDPAGDMPEGVSDGFVFTGGANRLRDDATVAAVTDRPGWLQLVGTGITAAIDLQCAAVLKPARWPTVTCREIFDNDLLTEPMHVTDGMMSIPDEPGLGFDVDRATLDTYACERPTRRPNPRRLIETDWSDGPTLYLAEGPTNFVLEFAKSGSISLFQPGVETRLVPDDGGDRWETLHDRARREPAWTDSVGI